MSLNLGRASFRCPKKTCRKEISIKKNSFFSTHRMKCSTILLIAYLWLKKMPITSIVSTCEAGSSQVSSIVKKIREMISGSLEQDDAMIGGEGIIVEIDEAKFGNASTTEAIALKVCGFLVV